MARMMLGRLTPSPGRDLMASFVVFLVALPLCMGIAIASGLPPEKGLVTGIVGGIVGGLLAGSPFQVSGPAAGLAVIVFDIVNTQGVGLLGPILILAGLFQVLAAMAGLGRWFRAISPAVIYGMLAGIGALILIAQIHVMLGRRPEADAIANLAAIPQALLGTIDGGSDAAALLIGLLTILLMVGWDKLKPRRLRFLPGALMGVVAAALAAWLTGAPVAYVDVPGNIMAALRPPGGGELLGLAQAGVIVTALTLAFIASAETLLSAGAVDRMHDGARTDYNKELRAQGIGNMICGGLGALPMTGVIVRSSTNVQAGAVSRWSAVLHGLWIALFVLAFPFILKLIPTASLGAILVVTGVKLMEVEAVKRLAGYGRMPLFVYAATFLGTVFIDLLTGVLVGIALSFAEVIYKAARLRVTIEEAGPSRIEMSLEGAATFLQTPRLGAILERLPPGTELHVRTAPQTYIDHACKDLLENWARQNRSHGARLVEDWQKTGLDKEKQGRLEERLVVSR
ncbi:Sulfate permease, MFS superfamily [Arboricoccus pini]|uniref:Sulfate permease, MFS superfamily n=1 Tax=Arboricoccus pini TaxID=1963835 RepID=A0A212QWT1_9PROT|nr:SulP family inorganic anion transporter [Arboricoccus pini]SNB64083.1 Sulfate permease, MFS superfamily [Arboricoccus pini]